MVKLYNHNKKAYKSMLEKFEVDKRVAIIKPTGTGKMYIALKWLFENRDKKCLFLCPNKAIMYQLKETMEENGLNLLDFPNLKLALYSNLLNWEQTEYEKEYDCIILDEFHRAGSEKWGSCVNTLLNMNQNSKILGLSATPTRYVDKKNMVDEIFEGNVANEITLAEAIASGILPFPKYIDCVYYLEDEINKREILINNLENGKQKKLQELINEAKSHLLNIKGIQEIINENITKPGKYIVFCKDINHIYEMKDEVKKWFSNIGEVLEYIVHSNFTSENNDKTLNDFQKNTDKVQLLFSVDMLNEGLHVKGIDGVVMLRTTESHIVFLQQLGRCLTTDNKYPTVIDIANNIDTYENIYNVRDEILEHLGYEGYYDEKIPQELKEKFKIYGYSKDIVGILKQIDFMNKPILTFEEKIEIIKNYLKESNKNYSDIYKRQIYMEYPIGKWKSEWRIKYNKGVLTKIKEDVLIKLGEDFEIKRSCILTFEEKIEIIKSYLKESGKSYKEITIREKYKDYLIGRWINHWRSKYNKGKLIETEINVLKEIGEDFVKEENLTFEEKIKIIKSYLKESGKSYKEITTKDRYKDYGIGYWLSEFRERFGKGKLSIHEEQVLTYLGENFNKKRKMISFKEKIKIIAEYLKESGKTYLEINAQDKYKNYPIGRWRFEWRTKHNKGELSSLEESILKSIGETFELSRNKRLNFNEKIEIIKNHLNKTGKSYSEIKYYEKCENYSIGYWKSDWKAKYNKGELSDLEEIILKSIGANFDNESINMISYTSDVFQKDKHR